MSVFRRSVDVHDLGVLKGYFIPNTLYKVYLSNTLYKRDVSYIQNDTHYIVYTVYCLDPKLNTYDFLKVLFICYQDTLFQGQLKRYDMYTY